MTACKAGNFDEQRISTEDDLIFTGGERQGRKEPKLPRPGKGLMRRNRMVQQKRSSRERFGLSIRFLRIHSWR